MLLRTCYSYFLSLHIFSTYFSHCFSCVLAILAIFILLLVYHALSHILQWFLEFFTSPIFFVTLFSVSHLFSPRLRVFGIYFCACVQIFCVWVASRIICPCARFFCSFSAFFSERSSCVLLIIRFLHCLRVHTFLEYISRHADVFLCFHTCSTFFLRMRTFFYAFATYKRVFITPTRAPLPFHWF